MDNANDLTNGKVSGKLLGFFFPMLLTNLLQQIYSVADTAIVGRGLGDNALGAVGNLSSLSLLIIGFSMGMTGGFAVIIAQNFGSGDMAAVRKSVAMSVKLSAILTVILTAAGCLLLKPVLLMMRTDPVILKDSLIYGYIIFGGLSATIAYNLLSGILRAAGDSRTPFIAIMISSAVNIALDCILIFLFHTGVEGAAAATVVSQGISALICFIKIKQMSVLAIRKDDLRPDAAMSLLLLKNGIPMACMNSVTAVGCMVVQGYVNDRGAAYTSAYSVCSKYLNLFMLPSLTAGFAVSSFVSQNFGAGKTGRIRQGVRVCLGIALVSYLCLGSAMALLSGQLADLMLDERDTIALAAEYLRICGAGLILLNILFIYRNAAQGMGYPFIPMLSGFAEMALRIPAIIFLLPHIGFRATAYAEIAAWIGALAMNFAAYSIHLRQAE
ncbi:MAG: MATE family efflux transporter [Oscillospiraceae bacterium]|nr:MATE family efflux transporter [Oscillospiraceae bacterium]